MPLIMVSGFPTSGKTTRAKQLYAYLEERILRETAAKPGQPPKYRLHLISDHTLSIPRAVYDLSYVPEHARSNTASEKDARQSIQSAVKRVLSDRDIIILDGLNYIKGYRYELYCFAKSVRTPSCILQIGCSKEKAREVNEERLRIRRERQGEVGPNSEKSAIHEAEAGQAGEYENEPYAPENWENLVFRYEEPNAMTRWDSPLFTLVWEDDEEQTRKVFDNLWDTIAGQSRKIIKPNQATVQRSRDVSGDYLYLMDSVTTDIVKRMAAFATEQSEDGGGELVIPRDNEDGSDPLVVDFPVGKKTLPYRLHSFRRNFLGMNRGGIGLEAVGNFSGADEIRKAFVEFVNDAFEKSS